jgi:hypothetical protein
VLLLGDEMHQALNEVPAPDAARNPGIVFVYCVYHV